MNSKGRNNSFSVQDITICPLIRIFTDNENRRSHTLLPCQPEPRNADRADSGDDQPQTAAYPQRRATGHFQTGICRSLPFSRYICKGRRKDNVDDITDNNASIHIHRKRKIRFS